MAGSLQRDPGDVERVDVLDRFDRMFDDWVRSIRSRRPLLGGHLGGADMIPVDEFEKDGAYVIRAELPGIDPERDVDVSVRDGRLTIRAERREESEVDEDGYHRRELRTGSFSRTLPLPEAVTLDDVTADYEDGILEIRVPVAEPPPARRIPVGRNGG